MFRFSRRAIFAALALSACTSVFSQASYPDKPIRLVVPYPPGGFTDILGRQLATQLQTRLGQNVIVDNKGGGGSTIGSAMVARAPADGYTLLLVAPDLAINESLMATRLSYDARKDFSPVIRAAWSPMVLVTHPSVPAKNVSEFLALAKARPGKINFASGGIGTGAHLALELFKTRAGVDLTHVPYKGNGPAYTDLISGQVPVMFPNITTALQHVRSGKLRALAVTGKSRTRLAPDIPTVAESGLPGYELNSWFGLLAPAGTPAALVSQLQQEIARLYQQPELRDKLLAQGVEPVASTPAEFTAQINAEIDYWARTFKAANLKPEM